MFSTDDLMTDEALLNTDFSPHKLQLDPSVAKLFLSPIFVVLLSDLTTWSQVILSSVMSYSWNT